MSLSAGEDPPAFLRVPPSSILRPLRLPGRTGMLSAGTKKCNWRNFPSSSFGEPVGPHKAIEGGAVPT